MQRSIQAGQVTLANQCDKVSDAVTGTRPWYREPWVLFIIALPASAVIAGLVTWYIAARGTDVPAPARPQTSATATAADHAALTARAIRGDSSWDA